MEDETFRSLYNSPDKRTDKYFISIIPGLPMSEPKPEPEPTIDVPDN